jgi:EmrB/QacA subfamily drug resistance transporter
MEIDMQLAARHIRHDSTAVDRRPWSILVLLSLAQFMVILDVTVVNVALPSIDEALDFARGDLQWVVTAYVLLTGGFLLLGGRATDVFGRRRVFLAGLALFTFASLASGLAPSSELLIGSRALQGLGAALLTPGALSIITTTYVGTQRATAFAVWGGIGGGGAAAGVVLGGLLTTWLGWRSIFFINLPVGIVVGALTLRLVPTAPLARGPRRRLDLAGALSVVAGLVVLVYAVRGTEDHGWGSARTLVLLALAAVLLAAFLAIERRVLQPLVPPATWKIRSLTSGVTLMLGATAILIGTFFLNSLYLQHQLGASALETGLYFLPLTAAIGVSSHVASRLISRAGARALAVAGLGAITAGSLLLSAAPDQASYLPDLLPGFLVLGLGVGLVFPAALVTAMTDVGEEQAGLGSGLMSTGHEIGAALGSATFSTVAATPASFAVGYGDGFMVAAVAAVVLAGLALVTVPAVRPAAGAPIAAH